MESQSKEEFYRELYYESDEEKAKDKSMRASKVKLQRSKDEISRTGRTDKEARQENESTNKKHHGASENTSHPIEAIDLTSQNSDPQLFQAHRPLPENLVVSSGNTPRSSSPRSEAAKPTTMPKRKRAAPPIPQAQQMLRGQQLFFLPDNDIAQGRRLRIQKAQEYGAVWVKKWCDNITHIIVDHGITYANIIKYLGIPRVPEHIVLVNELYPPHCVQYRHLVNPDQPQYQVEGYEAAKQQDEKEAKRRLEADDQGSGMPSKGDAAPREDHPPMISAAAVKTKDFASQEIISSNYDPPSSIASFLKLKPDKRGPEKTPSRANDSAESAASREARFIAEQKGKLKPYEPQRQLDALDEAISQAQVLENLPLDTSEPESEYDPETEPEDEERMQQAKKRKLADDKLALQKNWLDNFNCMKKSDGDPDSEAPNAYTIEVLQKMYEYYERIQDHWRILAYRKAITALKRQKAHITSKEQALAIPNIGNRLADKIEEIIWTGRLRRLDSTELEPHDEALQRFLKIYGVGYNQARAFVAKRYRTLEDLKTKASLTKNQLIGIERYDDFQTRIPRDEIGRHATLLRSVLRKVNPDIEVTVGGSYRRGAATSGDIDYIITARNTSMSIVRSQVLGEMMPRLWANRYLKCVLADMSPVDGTKWHGAAVLPGTSPPVWRRIDFLLVPHEEFGAALIYFTGNDIFNRSIRLLAAKKGMRLNQRGLWKDVIRGPERGKATDGTLVEAQSERRIFDILGVPWRPPEHRNC